MKKRIMAACLSTLGCVSPGKLTEKSMNLQPDMNGQLETLQWTSTPSEITKACEGAHTKIQEEVNQIAATETATFANTLERADRAFTAFDNLVAPLTFVRNVVNDPALQDAARTCAENSQKLMTQLFSRADFYAAIQRAVAKEEPQGNVQKQLLHDYQRAFEKNGLALPEDERQKLLQLRSELVNLESSYMKTLNAWNEKLDFSKKELQGLPTQLLNDLEKSQLAGKDFVLSLKYPHVIPALKYVKNAKVRKTIYEHFHQRGGPENSKRLEQAINLRLQIAKLLHYKNFAEYQLVDNMAKDPDTVTQFLSNLQKRLHKRTEKEFATLLRLKRHDQPKARDLDVWDLAYYENILLEKRYSLNDEEIKAYFPINKVISGMFGLYRNILDIEFEPLPNAPVWHPDVRSFLVRDRSSNQVLGQFYMDLHPRDGKFSHAANFGLISRYEKEDGHYALPISAVVANFTKPTSEQPGLLSHSEVSTLFHEFGHVMHHILSHTQYGSHSGMNVKRDFVEAPSQMLENWVWEKSILKILTSHYQTSAPMPDELIDQLIRTRFVNKAIQYTRQIFLSSIDMAYHTLQSTANLDVNALYQRYFHKIYLLKALPTTRSEAAFGHLMAGYEAGYYGYLWSEVYAADMFTRFQKEGLLNSKTGRDYRQTVLEKGGSEDPMELLTQFLGRRPNSKAFLELMDIHH